MTPDGGSPHHGRSQSIALLGIGTALIGFGLFTAELRGVAETIALLGVWRGLLHYLVSYCLMMMAVVFYLRLAGSVRLLLTKTNVGGEDVADGPMRYLLYLAAAVMFGFLVSLQ